MVLNYFSKKGFILLLFRDLKLRGHYQFMWVVKCGDNVADHCIRTKESGDFVGCQNNSFKHLKSGHIIN